MYLVRGYSHFMILTISYDLIVRRLLYPLVSHRCRTPLSLYFYLLTSFCFESIHPSIKRSCTLSDWCNLYSEVQDCEWCRNWVEVSIIRSCSLDMSSIRNVLMIKSFNLSRIFCICDSVLFIVSLIMFFSAELAAWFGQMVAFSSRFNIWQDCSFFMTFSKRIILLFRFFSLVLCAFLMELLLYQSKDQHPSIIFRPHPRPLEIWPVELYSCFSCDWRIHDDSSAAQPSEEMSE